MPRTEHSDQPSVESEAERPDLPEGTERVVVLEHNHNAWGKNPNEYRCQGSRLAQYDDVDFEEYVDEDEDPENVTIIFGPGDVLPLPLAADGTYRAFPDMFACFDAEGERLDAAQSANADEGIQKWQAGGGR